MDSLSKKKKKKEAGGMAENIFHEPQVHCAGTFSEV